MKKMLALFLILSLTLSLAACGANPATPTTEPAVGTTAPADTPTEAPTQSTTGDSCVTTEPDVTAPNTEESIEDIKAQVTPSKRTYTYDDMSNLILISGEEQIRLYTAEYDETGRIIREDDYYNGESVTHSCYEYLSDGGWITTLYGTDGRTETTYDSEGKQVLSISYLDSTESYRAVYTYNEHGDVVEMKQSYDPLYFDEETRYTYAYEYDDNGNWVKKTVYWNGDLEQYFTRSYTESGTLTEEFEYYATGEEAVHYSYFYDKAGNLSETLCYDETKLLYIESCTYDENGWLLEELTYYIGG